MTESDLILWTVQDARILPRLTSSGQFRGSFSRVYDAETRCAYRWMAEMMVKKGITRRPKCPIWGWYRYRGHNKPRPDLRDSWHLARGTHGLLLELQVQPSQVLLSQFDMWTCVMSKLPVPFGVNDPVLHGKATTIELLKTWERIFDLDFGESDYWGDVPGRAIQACIPALRLSDVVRIEKFVAR